MFSFGGGTGTFRIVSSLIKVSLIFKELPSGLICAKGRNSARRHHRAEENLQFLLLFLFMISGLKYHLLDYLQRPFYNICSKLPL